MDNVHKENITKVVSLVRSKDFRGLSSFLDGRNDLELYLCALELSTNLEFTEAFDYILTKDLDFSSSKAVSVCAMSDNTTGTFFLKRLLDDGRFNPNGNENSGEPFYYAASFGNINNVGLLLSDSRTDPSLRYNRGIIYLIISGHTHLVKDIIQKYDIDISIPNQDIIIEAAKTNDLELIELLLSDERVDPSYNDNIAAVLSTRGNNINIVCAFLRHPKVDINRVYNRIYEEYNKDGTRIIDEAKIKLRDEIIDEILR